MRRRSHRRPISAINVVPYIDVMLVLLVIFMITAPLLAQGVKIDLPTAAAKPIPESKEPLVVTIDSAGRFYLNVGDGQETGVTSEVLVSRVSTVLRHRPETPVMVRGDEHVDYGKVIRLMSLLQNAGAPSVGMLTEPPAGRKR
ncbi:MAG: protein TolR [Gammaproteobacteria bacterium]|nr:protein TolR [Gammaproteobacteria bacterium]